MSIQTLYTAATGMLSMEGKLDVIANNLANVNTTGFKKDRAAFEDNFYRHDRMPGAQTGGSNPTAVGIHTGMGSKITSVQTNFTQGAFDLTGDPFDVAIEGNGFFQVTDPASGQTVYSRAGNFSLNADGQFVMGSAGTGRVVEPPIQIPNDATFVSIAPDGRVTYQQSGETTATEAGQFQLAVFTNPEGLLKVGENLFLATEASGDPAPGTPQTPGYGALRQNALEASNVEPVRELIDLITTQRSFEMNSQAVQAGDQVLELVANLRRF